MTSSGIGSAVRRALMLAAKTAAIAGVIDASGCGSHDIYCVPPPDPTGGMTGAGGSGGATGTGGTASKDGG